MKTLLKDMPEHMERIENNRPLIQEIEYLIEYGDGNIAEQVINSITEFINQNYTWKGI